MTAPLASLFLSAPQRIDLPSSLSLFSFRSRRGLWKLSSGRTLQALDGPYAVDPIDPFPFPFLPVGRAKPVYSFCGIIWSVCTDLPHRLLFFAFFLNFLRFFVPSLRFRLPLPPPPFPPVCFYSFEKAGLLGVPCFSRLDPPRSSSAFGKMCAEFLVLSLPASHLNNRRRLSGAFGLPFSFASS